MTKRSTRCALPRRNRICSVSYTHLVRKYDVDGIHLDDYFYPGTDFADEATFIRYGEDFDDIGDWRRDNVNQLIAALDETLHEIDPTLSFGAVSYTHLA